MAEATTPVKFHILFAHIAPYCKELKCGPGIVSEQALEALHAKFYACDHHLIKNPDSDQWCKNKMRSVLEWNALACVP